MLNSNQFEKFPENIEIRRRHDMTGSIVIFRLSLSVMFGSTFTPKKKNQLNLKLNERKEKRNQTILSISLGRDYNKCRSHAYSDVDEVVRNALALSRALFKSKQTKSLRLKVALSFFPWKTSSS